MSQPKTESRDAPEARAEEPSAAFQAGFDAEWYLFRYPEVGGFQGGPANHFREFGYSEERAPSPYVDLRKLHARRPDLRGGGMEAAMECIASLSSDEREAILPDDAASLAYLLIKHRLFDNDWYAAENRDLEGWPVPLLTHFVDHGGKENREPGPGFDSEFYRATYPHLIDRSASPIEDYVRYGLRRGYAPKGATRYQRWIAEFDLLTAEDLARIARAGAGLPPRSLVVHVIDAAACCHGERIIAAWQARADDATPVHFLRGKNVDDAAWQTFCAAVPPSAGMAVAAGPELPLDHEAHRALLLCAGPVLARPHAGVVFASFLHGTAAHAAYADHDVVDAAGERTSPCFKPSMSPEFMKALPYAGPMLAVAPTADNESRILHALREAVEGDAPAAFARFLLETPRADVARVPFILFHAMERLDAGASDGAAASRAPSILDPLPTVSIVIPTRDQADILRTCIDSLRNDTDYPRGHVEIIVVDNDSREADARAYLAELARAPDIGVVSYPEAFNFAAICNLGAERARNDILVFLNNDMSVNRRDWLRRLVAQALVPDVGLVGAQLLFPDGKVQHGGVVLGVQGIGAHRLRPADVGPAAALDRTRETVAVTGACLAVRKAVFTALGGFDPVLRVAFNDVKLCIAAHQSGLRNIYIGEPLLFHHESRSRGFDSDHYKQRRNARESIYVREHGERPFRDDAYYSPNLSLQAVDNLAMPPRVLRPWRRSPVRRRRVLLLSNHHTIGYGVAVVLQQQAHFLRDRGWEVIVGGPRRAREVAYDGCRRVDLWTAEGAATLAMAEGVDVVVAHTDPFFSIARFLGDRPLLYVVDHGEPPPALFEDREQREALDWEKRFCAPMARRVFVISETIRASQFRSDAIVLRNGNSHLARWSAEWHGQRGAIRERLGLDDQFVVLTVCRFGAKDRIYKGVTHYAEVASDLPFLHPGLPRRATFILAGRGDGEDVAEMQAAGLQVHANPTDAELVALYAAADLYLSFSRWEGYNLGIGQARAMGLDAIASDISAHREFGIETSDSIPDLCSMIADRIRTTAAPVSTRTAIVEPWDIPLSRMADHIDADLAALDEDDDRRGLAAMGAEGAE